METQQIYLMPGELTLVHHPAEISTLLGSCVSVTIHSTDMCFGAICHAMLPHSELNEKHFKYLDCALIHIFGAVQTLGIDRNKLIVQLFGGAEMFENRLRLGKTQSVGKNNIDMALSLLHREGLRPQRSDVGGSNGRKITFYPHTGRVQVKSYEKPHIHPGRPRA